ncbi:MAG: AtpZ/AtpI family protein [Myxococcota bacterium]
MGQKGAMRYRVLKASGALPTLGLDIVLSLGVGFFGGRWLDGRFGTEPWFAMLGLVFGLGAAGRFVFRATQKMRRETEEDEYGRRRGRSRHAAEEPRS